MPIITISRIQHRRGDYADLPQLASGELGWAVDEQRLFIGNGSIAEGAPEVGNTEILTVNSDIFSLLGQYTYIGNTGYTVQTGPTTNEPVARSIQARLDDVVSVKAFGAVGDGITDDTSAINRALYELYTADTNTPANRRTLYFPAGTYKVTATIKIPSYAHLLGDGKEKTRISNPTVDSSFVLARTADSLQQIGVNIGNNGATVPQYIDIEHMTMDSQGSEHVLVIESAKNINVSNVRFSGRFANLDVTPEDKAGVKFTGSASADCEYVTFNACEWRNLYTAVICDDDYNQISITNSYFRNLRYGIMLGENTTGLGASITGPRGFRVTHSFFDAVDYEALKVFTPVTATTSAFNQYNDVGTEFSGAAATSSATSVVVFQTAGNSSIHDIFERAATDNPYVDLDLKGSLVLSPGSEHQFGGMSITDANGTITLSDNQTSSASTGITFDSTNDQAVEIFYKIVRGTKIRNGVLYVTSNTTAATADDSYSENNGDVGVELSVNLTGSVTTVRYTTTSTGSSAFFQYSVKKLRTVV